MPALYVQDNGAYNVVPDHYIIDCARDLLARKFKRGSPVLSEPREVMDLLRLRLHGCDYEVFGVLHLDSHNRLIAFEELFRGSVASASVPPREVLRSVMQHNGAAVILFHNHPSGVAKPSRADEKITRDLKTVLALIDVNVLDHWILGDEGFSFSEHGLI
jgi:DNA repair protein RadC